MILLCGNSTTDFIKEQISVNSKYNLVFIDGGYEYNVIKSDYLLSLKNIKEGPVIVYHDIDSNLCNGPKQLWLEIKKNPALVAKQRKETFIKTSFKFNTTD